MTEPSKTIPEIDNVTPAQFHEEIIPAGKPVVFRGLVADWPVVRAHQESPQAMCAYLQRFDRGRPITTAMGPPGIKGRFFYQDDLSALNFRMGQARLSVSLDYLLDHAGDPAPAAYAVQSVTMRDNMPGFEEENRNPLLDPAIGPRLWIGNRVTIAAHYDPSENIACVVGGRRRFTVFPPDQVGNLYSGPFELTPAGPTISMVDFDNPDLEKFPRFPDAMAQAMYADLEPGDAIYVPYLWWHHVRSKDPVSALVNYWWEAPAQKRGHPRDVLIHAMMAIRDLPAHQRAAWKAMFEHYVFDEDTQPGDHLPAARRGVLGDLSPDQVRHLRKSLAQALISRD